MFTQLHGQPLFLSLFLHGCCWGETDSTNLHCYYNHYICNLYFHFDGHLIRGFKKLWQAIQHMTFVGFLYSDHGSSFSLVDKKGMDFFCFPIPNTPFQKGIAFFFLEATIGFTICNLYLFSNHSKTEILVFWKNDWLKALVGAFATLGSMV
ncbi:MAG: hypothetical protein Ct9H300mP23_00310 [Nitrospinota bacterium]|nr:MAG: hypothetical protein Ct9H300mP23_00310 [Nitrospinota bacterium]